MPSAAQIKAAARKLPAADRADLLAEFAGDHAVRKEQLARLRVLIEEGVRDHKEGRYIEIRTKEEHRALYNDVIRRVRTRSKKSA